MRNEFATNPNFSPIKGIVIRRIQNISEQIKSFDPNLTHAIDSSVFQYDGIKITARDILGFLPSQSASDYVDRPLKKLRYELGIVELLEKGGIEEVNRYLDELLRKSQSTKSREQASEINNLLLSAIHLFPHLVAGISIKRKEGVPHTELDSIFTDHQQSNNLFLPLPFENNILWEENRKFDLSRSVECSFLPGKTGMEPAVIIYLNLQGKPKHREVIDVNDIELIQFTTEDHFTPFVVIPAGLKVDASNAGEFNFHERPNPVDHYLHFIHAIHRDGIMKDLLLQAKDMQLIALLAQRV